jgi:hypothetical protein
MFGNFPRPHTHTHGCDPLDPHDTPLRIDADERDNHLTHDLKCFFLTVLAGPIPGCASGYCILHVFETVRHVTPASLIPPFPSWGLFLCASSSEKSGL